MGVLYSKIPEVLKQKLLIPIFQLKIMKQE